jgi:hypothetical protein
LPPPPPRLNEDALTIAATMAAKPDRTYKIPDK